MRWGAAAAAAAAAAATLAAVADARSFVEVRRDEEVCFLEDALKGDRLRGSFQVVEGGYLDIDMSVKHVKSNKNVVEQWRKEEGTFDFLAEEEGLYRICFGNRFSTNSRKKLQLSIHRGEVDELVEHEANDLAEVGHVDKLSAMVQRLARRVSDLKEQEEYLRRRSERHHRTAENNNSRVLLSSVCEAVVLVAVNLWQIYYLRRFFEVKRMI